MREGRLDDLAGMIRLLGRPVAEASNETRAARPRSCASRASGAVASPRAACRPDWETDTDWFPLRASVPRPKSPWRCHTAGPGAPGSPSSGSTRPRPDRSLPRAPLGPSPSVSPSAPGTRTPAGRPASPSMPTPFGWPQPPLDGARPACAARNHAGDPGPGRSGRTGCLDPMLHRHRPFQHRTEALAQPPGGLRLRVPDGGEDLEQVGARDLRHRHLPDPREGVPLRER